VTRRRPGIRSLRAKLLWGTILVTCLVMAAVMVVVEHRQRVAIIGEVQRRGEVLARNLAAISQGPLLLYNFTALEQNVTRVAAEADVVYAIVLDADGRVAAYSGEPQRVGAALDGPVDRRAAVADRPLVQDTRVRAGGESIYDFAVPVVVNDQRWGTVRVGLSRRRMDAEIWRTRWELGLLTLVTLLLGGVAAGLVADRIARPARQLAEGAAAISRGDLNQRIEPTTRDEVGRLAAAFNHMAAQLLQQRTALEDAHAQLHRRFEELADLKSYTDNILSSLTSGVVTVDLEGRVVTLNPAAELLTGYFAGEVSGRYCTDIFAQSPEIGEILMETLVSRTPVPGVALTFRRRSGRALPVEFSAAPLKGGESKALGALGLFRDLTAVRELEHQLQRSDRLAALGTLAAGLAHEIRNPLTSLLTFTRHLPRKLDDEAFRQRFLSVVPRELERINGIVGGLLDLGRPPRLSLKRVHVSALLERVVELYAPRLETQGVRLARTYANDVPAIVADEEALYQALVNLVANALDAMRDGGRLTLRIGWSDPAGLRRATGRRSFDRHVKIEIEDTGPGIPAADADRVFNPFFTTKEQGTGLGLALAHRVVEDHGGTLSFRGSDAGGTTFVVVLPPVAELTQGPLPHDDEVG
jgi:two-component system sensor histidine kinase AtoS